MSRSPDMIQIFEKQKQQYGRTHDRVATRFISVAGPCRPVGSMVHRFQLTMHNNLHNQHLQLFIKINCCLHFCLVSYHLARTHPEIQYLKTNRLIFIASPSQRGSNNKQDHAHRDPNSTKQVTGICPTLSMEKMK